MRIFLLVISALMCLPALAGSRNGYRIVAINNVAPEKFENSQLLLDYFNNKLSPDTYRCERNNLFIDFDLVYIKRRPKKVTSKLIEASLNGDKASLEELRRALRTFKDTEIDKGFDGIIIFTNKDSRFDLTTVGSIASGYKRTAHITTASPLTSVDLKKLFCESFSELEYAYPGL